MQNGVSIEMMIVDLPHILFGTQWYIERANPVQTPEDHLREYQGTIRLANARTKLYLSPTDSRKVRIHIYPAVVIIRGPDGYFRESFHCSPRNICGV